MPKTSDIIGNLLIAAWLWLFAILFGATIMHEKTLAETEKMKGEPYDVIQYYARDNETE